MNWEQHWKIIIAEQAIFELHWYDKQTEEEVGMVYLPCGPAEVAFAFGKKLTEYPGTVLEVTEAQRKWIESNHGPMLDSCDYLVIVARKYRQMYNPEFWDQGEE
jgi:hypothetical protein